MQQLVVQQVKKRLGKDDDKVYTRYEYAKNAWKRRQEMWSAVRSIAFMTAGVISAGFGLRSFLIPNGFIDGGVMGISLLVNKETNTARDYEKELKKRLAPFNDVPVIFISAKEKTRIFKAMEKALEVYDNKKRKIPTSKLNDVMLKAIESYHAPVVRGHAVKIKFVTQLPTHVPSFSFFCNYPDDIKQPYKNYLENQLRQNFSFTGVPVRIFFRKK